MEYEKLTETNIGLAYSIVRTRRGGFLERIYERCPLIELRKAGLEREKLNYTIRGRIRTKRSIPM